MERTLDTVVWQMLASVIIPGYTIHTLVAAVHAGLLPLESTRELLDFFESAAPALSSTPAVRARSALQSAGSPVILTGSPINYADPLDRLSDHVALQGCPAPLDAFVVLPLRGVARLLLLGLLLSAACAAASAAAAAAATGSSFT